MGKTHTEGGKMKVYLSGKITGDENYKEKFANVESCFRNIGHSVMNPANLNSYPEFSWEDYMEICIAMLKVCDAVYVIDGENDSRGVKLELEKARELDIPISNDFFDFVSGGKFNCRRIKCPAKKQTGR